MARARVNPAQLTQQLQRLLCSLTTPQAWESLITRADGIGQYTARNRALILSQYPEATNLAGSAKWSGYGRAAAGGQRGLCLVATTRAPGSGTNRGPQAQVFAPDLRPPHEQEASDQVEAGQGRERYRGQTGATVVKVWDVDQTVKSMDCAACGHGPQVPCVSGCRGIPAAPTQAVPPIEWWQLIEELPDGVDPLPIGEALNEVVFLV